MDVYLATTLLLYSSSISGSIESKIELHLGRFPTFFNYYSPRNVVWINFKRVFNFIPGKIMLSALFFHVKEEFKWSIKLHRKLNPAWSSSNFFLMKCPSVASVWESHTPATQVYFTSHSKPWSVSVAKESKFHIMFLRYRLSGFVKRWCAPCFCEIIAQSRNKVTWWVAHIPVKMDFNIRRSAEALDPRLIKFSPKQGVTLDRVGQIGRHVVIKFGTLLTWRWTFLTLVLVNIFMKFFTIFFTFLIACNRPRLFGHIFFDNGVLFVITVL